MEVAGVIGGRTYEQQGGGDGKLCSIHKAIKE
jgi:hypothetical protein